MSNCIVDHETIGSYETGREIFDRVLSISEMNPNEDLSIDNCASDEVIVNEEFANSIPSGRAAQRYHSDHQWASSEHRHSGSTPYTPKQKLTGSYRQGAKTELSLLATRYADNPEHFVKGGSLVKSPSSEVAINLISVADSVEDMANLPILHAAGYKSNAS